MKLACIVLGARLPEQLACLLSALRSRQVHVYLHIDRREPIDPLHQALPRPDWMSGPCYPGVTPDGAARRSSTPVWTASRAASADGCQYFTLISGQDFPLHPIEGILDFADAADYRSYVESFSLPTARWRFRGRDRTDFYTYYLLGRRETCIPRGEDTSFFNWKGRVLNQALRLRTAFKPPRRFPPYVRPFGGSQWWNLSRAAAEYVLRFLHEHPDYRSYHDYTLAPDELFFQSIC